MIELVTNLQDMKEVIITKEMRDRAFFSANQYKDNLKNSIRNGDGTFGGALGEELVHAAFPFLTHQNTYNYDFLFGDKKLEIKTKERNVIPEVWYEASVNSVNGKQDADFYIFTSILKTFERGWVIGYIPTKEYWKIAELKTGKEKNMVHKFADHTYNIKYSQLYKFK